ncbi:hypothetical protein EV193_104395 [Herbihabitans rhizosphaerae]|uniref:Uncharacterized protein n=1 Tax=Herbihabitans rhizosphaerae TaxID=1872711 RepID=A0A4Q7KQS0_9PSEU|nr:hypothetical protein [Herbihabitans rhizosphaerae]RZS39179.1 hypothetical protein EV193_104395 [Herbihabitans rhizosphaerae]
MVTATATRRRAGGDVVSMRQTSPCEHGVAHGIRALPVGADFWVPECVTANGKTKRAHTVTAERYPVEVTAR